MEWTPIGRVRTPFQTTDAAPRRGCRGEAECTIDRLVSRYPTVDVLGLFRESAAVPDRDLVTVDRAALTTRQREAMETAHAMGYFEHPKGANATAVAAALDITRSTVAEHLTAAHRTLDAGIFDAAGRET